MTELVRVLDKTTRVMQTMSMRIDVLSFGQRQCERRIGALERRLLNSDPRIAAVWESWKSRLSPACGKVIDALLLHGELNSVQLKVAARLGTSTVSDSISKLNKAGLINKNGNRFSLKAL